MSRIDIAVSESPSNILLNISHAKKPSPFPLEIQRFKAQRKTEKTWKHDDMIITGWGDIHRSKRL
jgi:hypothetical protein